MKDLKEEIYKGFIYIFDTRMISFISNNTIRIAFLISTNFLKFPLELNVVENLVSLKVKMVLLCHVDVVTKECLEMVTTSKR